MCNQWCVLDTTLHPNVHLRDAGRVCAYVTKKKKDSLGNVSVCVLSSLFIPVSALFYVVCLFVCE